MNARLKVQDQEQEQEQEHDQKQEHDCKTKSARGRTGPQFSVLR